MTNTTTSGAADLPEALRSIQRFEVVDCIDDKHVPAVIPKTHGPWVRYEDHIAALAAGQAAAAQAVVQDDLITIRKPTTSAEMLWLLKLAHLVISDVDKTLEETFSPAQPAAQPGAAYAALPDEGEPWRGHKFKEVQRGCWRCDCGKTIKEVTSDQSTPASGGNYPVMPKRYTVDDDGEELFTAEKMRAFADATHALRASHGQAPAGAGMGHTDGGRNMFYEGRFDGESQREQQARLRWANDMRAAFERHTGNGWFDKDWRTETGLWSSAWHACLAAHHSHLQT